MTKEQAAAVVAAQKSGQMVTVAELQTALSVLARKRDRCCRLPALTEAARLKANLALIWNLWQAGRAA